MQGVLVLVLVLVFSRICTFMYDVLLGNQALSHSNGGLSGIAVSGNWYFPIPVPRLWGAANNSLAGHEPFSKRKRQREASSCSKNGDNVLILVQIRVRFSHFFQPIFKQPWLKVTGNYSFYWNENMAKI